MNLAAASNGRPPLVSTETSMHIPYIRRVEHGIAFVAEIRGVEHAFAEFLHDIGRELDGCRSLTQVRELFRPEIHDLEALAEARVLQRGDEIFMPGIHATALVKAIDVELARVTADVMRAFSYRGRD
jgi:hypothetical protein